MMHHKLSRVKCILFCNLQSWARTHAVLTMGLYELFGNLTTYLIEPPGLLTFVLNVSWEDACCIKNESSFEENMKYIF
jgi:hypothetical protein